MHLNWLAKSICWGPGLPSVDTIGNKCCTRVLLYAKMLKKTENEETRLFSHIFSFGGILIGGDPGLLGPPTGYAYDCKRRSEAEAWFGT